MSREDEDLMMGLEMHLVPKIDAGEYCNARKSKEIEHDKRGPLNVFKGYCNAVAGQGTDHVGEGRCKYHGGCSTGAPKHNQNGGKTYTRSDPHKYAESLPQREREFVENTTATILDRLRAVRGDVDLLDRILANRVAIKLHMVSKASDYVRKQNDLVQSIQTEHGSHDAEIPLIDEIRKHDDSIIRNLEKLGLVNDPESKKADALDSWKQYIQQGVDDDEDRMEQLEAEIDNNLHDLDKYE